EPVPTRQDKSLQVAEDLLYDRLVQTLHDMQAQIEERVRPLAQQTVKVEIQRLREQSRQNQTALVECLARIDQGILSCIDRIGEYQSGHAELLKLNQRLATLGADPQPLPHPLPTHEGNE